jgi:histone-lysine N-methyltransferase EZH2
MFHRVLETRFLAVPCRNQQTAEDQSVFGRQMIYYDSNCGEALVCSDEEGKHEFKGFEDYIIR